MVTTWKFGINLVVSDLDSPLWLDGCPEFKISTMEDEAQPIRAFVHNISPLKKSGKRSYFEMDVQTKDSVIRGVYFGSQKHDELQNLSKRKAPLNITKYTNQTKWNVDNILMNTDTIIQEAEEIDFDPVVPPKNQTIATLSTVAIGQLVSLKGQIVQITPPKQAMTQNGPKVRAEAFILDPHGSIKIVLWGNFVDECKEELTYDFKNLRLQKDVRTQELCLSTPKSGCTVTQCDPFEERLPLPSELPEVFTKTTVTSEILGINDFTAYLACCKCTKKVSPDASPIVDCRNCGLKQKLKNCNNHFFLKAFVKQNEAQLTLTIFDTVLMPLFSSLDIHPTSIEESAITEATLNLPDLDITFDNKSKIVSKIVKNESS